MQIQNQTVVSLRYIMKNAAGETLEENLNSAPVQYLHGAGKILPLLESSLYGLKAGDRKLINLYATSGLPGDFTFDVIIDEVRKASEDEIQSGNPVIKKDKPCGPGCNC